MRPKVVLCGSYHRKPDILRQIFRELEVTGCRVLSPISLDFDTSQSFVATINEVNLSNSDIERFHLRAIRDADFIMVHVPDGHVGVSTSYEMGFAAALGKPVFTYQKPADEMLSTRVQIVSSTFEILDQLQLTSF